MILEKETIQRETAILVSVAKKGGDRAIVFEHLDELELLADTAGVLIADRMIQERVAPDGATYIGKGKVEELKALVVEHQAQLVLADDELSPMQIRNLERELEVKVIDRSALILDIFATRARSVEAKTQVELAQLQYLMPRLSRMWTHLSKQYGGVGTKGPGETQIESDRRMIKIRIQRLKEKLKEIDVQKREQRKQRLSMMRFALVGYTNAGKSTLMNIMTDAEVYVEDRLFATLDTTVRQITLPGGQTALLSDTVGFIRKLPAHLIASFRSTLAESIEADMIIHVVDASHHAFREHLAVVRETLESLKAENKPTIVVFNKTDAVEDKEHLRSLEYEYPGSIQVSAVTGFNVREILRRMQEFCDSAGTIVDFEIPYSSMKELAVLYEISEVLSRSETDSGIRIRARISASQESMVKNKFMKYISDVKPFLIEEEQ